MLYASHKSAWTTFYVGIVTFSIFLQAKGSFFPTYVTDFFAATGEHILLPDQNRATTFM